MPCPSIGSKRFWSVQFGVLNLSKIGIKTGPKHWPSPPGTFHILIGKFSYFIIGFLNHIFLSLSFPISTVIRYLLSSSIVKFDNKIGKVNDKKNLI